MSTKGCLKQPLMSTINLHIIHDNYWLLVKLRDKVVSLIVATKPPFFLQKMAAIKILNPIMEIVQARQGP
jgi:hypothetical protein